MGGRAAPGIGYPRPVLARTLPLLLAVALLATMPGRAGAGSKPSADTLGLGVPGGSRVVAVQTWRSGRSFRKTVQYYQKLLSRRGIARDELPVYRYRGVVVARFLATDPAARWAAIHVSEARGETRIYLLPAKPLDPAEKPR